MAGDEEIAYIDPKRLRPHPYNDRIYRDRADPEFVASIEARGIIDPLVVTAALVILSGHRRWKAALQLKFRQVPYRVVHVENEAVTLVEFNRHRQKTMGERMKEAQVLEAELAPAAVMRRREGGRKGGRISRRGRRTNLGPGLAEASVSARQKTRVIVAEKLGLGQETYRKIKYVLGSAAATDELKRRLENNEITPHRAYLETHRMEQQARERAAGAEREHFRPQIVQADALRHLDALPAGVAGLAIVDPPTVSGKGRARFLELLLIELKRILAPRGSAYVFAEHPSLHEFVQVGLKAGLVHQATIVWRERSKPGPGPGWSAGWSPLIHFSRSKEFTWTPRGGLLNLVEVPSVLGSTAAGQRPLALVHRLIEVSSRPGELILDPCAGSGTTGVAAQALGRRSLLIENNPECIPIIQQRLQSKT